MRYRNRSKISLKPALGLFMAFFVIGMLGNAAWGAYNGFREARVRALAAEAELRDLEKRHEALRNDINRIETVEGLEAELRTRFNVAHPGEQVIIIVDKPEGADTSGARESKEARWWEHFFSWFK